MANEQYDYLSEGDPMKVSGPTRNELLNVRSEAAALAVGNLIYVSGWSETYKLPLVTKADADASRRMATWICPEAIAQNANGTVAKAMRLIGTASANVDTSSTTVGDPIYLSATAGGWTKTDPAAAGAISQIIGRVAVVSATVGEIVFDMVAEGPTPKALGSSEIQDLSVTTAKIAATAVTTAKIAADAVTNVELANITRGSVKVGGTANAPTDLDAKTDKQILIGDGTDVVSVAVSGDVTITNTGAVTIANTQHVAGDQVENVANGNLVGGVPVLHRIAIADAASGNSEITLTHKTRVVDVWVVKTVADGHATEDTIVVGSGANAITNAMAIGANDDKSVTRAATIDDANHEIAAAGALRVTWVKGASGGNNVDCIVYVLGVRVA